MPRISPVLICLCSYEQATLSQRAVQYTLPYYQVIRAKIVLLAVQGLSNEQIAARLDTHREVVCKWRRRFSRYRLAGLEELPRPGRPRAFSPSGGRGGQSHGL